MTVTLLLLLFVSGGALSSRGVASKRSSTSVYYVNSKQHSCSGAACHTLSHYTNKTDWSPNTTLIFLPGEHELHAHLIIEKLDTVVLKGQGNDPPVIKCTKESLMLKIKDCNGVNIEGIAIKCGLLSLVDNNATIVTNISASQSYFRNSKPSSVFSTLTISHSKFMCDKKPTQNCVGIYHNTGRIILQNVITSNKYWSWIGIDIRSNGRINISLCNVSAIGNNNNGIRIALNKRGKVALTGINVSNNNKDGIYFWCSGSTRMHQTNNTSRYCSYGDDARFVFYCNGTRMSQ